MNDYDRLTSKFHDFFTQDPNACVMLGVNKYLDELPDPSVDAERAGAEHANELLSQVRAFPRTSLTFDQQLDLDLAALALEYEAFTPVCEGRMQLQQMPTAGHDISQGIFQLFINDPRPSAERLQNITARIEKIPEYLKTLLTRLDRPLQRWADIDHETIEELPELFKTIHDWAAGENYKDIARLSQASDHALNALHNYCINLSAMQTTRQFALGEEQARKLVSINGIDDTFEDLITMAKEHLEENTAIIENLKRKLIHKYQLPRSTTTQELHAFLNERYAVPLEDILPYYNHELANLMSFVRERNLFPIPEEQEMLIIKTPNFMEPVLPLGALDMPPPFREGKKRSVIYLTLNEDSVYDHTRIKIPNMLLHEGIPGHHLQLSCAHTNPSIIRKHLEANDNLEGWATMLEDYLLDAGYMVDLTDESRFLTKLDNLRFAPRVAIDLYFMTGNKTYLDIGVNIDASSEDPFVNAANLLRAVTGFSESRVQAELGWYSQEPVYPLSYLV
ncbi:DUF885 family protein, partial [Candidatus Woesearchaeota archaeon]|nr:DUF885 family protein [Candidatus Woesearchaeota archaeon]